MLTIAVAKAAEPRARAYKLADAHGLYLFVAPTGLKSWRMKYRRGGKERLLTFGRFPELSLADARVRREAAKAQLRDGICPATAIAGDDFRSVALAWHELQCPRWSPAHAADVLSSLERDVFPAIGARPIGAVRATELLNVIGSVERRGHVPTARRLRQRLSCIFRYAISQELAAADPAAQLDQAMRAAPLARPMPALATIAEVRELLDASDRAGGMSSVRLASRFLALTAVRLAAVRGARWEEFEGLDGEPGSAAGPVWRVPAARMKLSRAKKAVDRFDHVVPLSAPAVDVLRAAANLFPYFCGGACLPECGPVFLGRDGRSPIGEGAIGSLYARAGFAGRHVPHGWRATFSTILNEELGEQWRAAIDRALAHAPKDKVEAAYNRSEQLDRRRALFDRWGALLAG